MTNADPDDAPTPAHAAISTAQRRGWTIGAIAVVVVAAAAIVFALATGSSPSSPQPPAASGIPSSDGTGVPVPSVSPEEVAALPAAIYNAVIPGLLPYTATDVAAFSHSYTSAEDVPVFGADRVVPVAKLPALNFLEQPTVIAPVEIDGDWALVLTPSRQSKPSEADGNAPAQTSGWVPLSFLAEAGEVDSSVTISVSQQTLTISRDGATTEYAVGVGTSDTPTPTGTTGYIQARYEDPTQGPMPIQLTTLHSSAADDPWLGEDGGLIGMHFNTTSTGEVSHGCIRLPEDALLAVNELPLGTPVAIVD